MSGSAYRLQVTSTVFEKTTLVLIPGIMGSRLYYGGNRVWEPEIGSAYGGITNFETYLKPNEDGSLNENYPLSYARQNANDFGAVNTYQTIYNYLTDTTNFPSSQYDVKFFTYDWRLGSTENANRLANELVNDRKIILIAHSMGGLVASAYLAMGTEYSSKVEKLITFGTPYLGAAKAIGVFETGGLLDWWQNLAIGQQIKRISANTTSTYELLPTSRTGGNFLALIDYLTSFESYYSYSDAMDFFSDRPWAKKSDGTEKPMLASAEAFHDSLMVGNSHIANYFGASYYIFGYGHSTPDTAVYEDFAGALGYLSYYEISAGDGTVTSQSAKNMTTYFNYYGVSADHTDLVSDPDALYLMKSIIAGETTYAPYSASSSAFESSLVRETLIEEENTVDCVSVVIQGIQNLRITDADGNELLRVGEKICRVNPDGTIAEVGCVWLIDIDRLRFQYVLEPGEYQFDEIELDESIQPEISVMSFEDDLYTSKIKYDGFDAISEISLDVAFGGSVLIDKATMEEIIPVKVATSQEIQAINANRGAVVN
jgi:pimeloyl-ACP methyl ester carboxylesterase